MSPIRVLKNLTIFLAIWFASFWALPSWAAETYSNGEAHISYLEGQVLLKNDETKDWIEASKNLPVKSNDNLWVPAGGRAEIRFSEGSFARLSENTALQIGKLERSDEGARTELILTQGTATFVARAPYKGGMEFLVDTPNLTINAPEQAVFRLDVGNQGASALTVHRGTVAATSSEGTVEIGPGQAASFDEGKMNSQERYAKNNWDRWNDQRDAMYASAKSRKYLPPSMAADAADLDNNGRWVHTAEYGDVWAPNEPPDWTPYSNGEWDYVGPDLVWVPFEPWGWTPFHYGRWAFLPIGWAWVPPLPVPLPFPVWLPAGVTWFFVGDTFCWVPLAPGEFFFGWRVFGPGCFLWSDPFFRVHVTNVFVFRNALVTNAIVGFPRNAVFNPHHTPIHVSKTLLNSGHVKLGDPGIKATRASFNPNRGKVVPSKSLPPSKVMRQTTVAKSKGLQRVSSNLRQTALTKPLKVGKGLTPYKGTMSGKLKGNAPAPTSKPFKPGVEKRGIFSSKTPTTGKVGVQDRRNLSNPTPAVRGNKGVSNVKPQTSGSQSTTRGRTFLSGEPKSSPSLKTSRGSSTGSSSLNGNRSRSSSFFGKGSSGSSNSGNKSSFLGRSGSNSGGKSSFFGRNGNRAGGTSNSINRSGGFSSGSRSRSSSGFSSPYGGGGGHQKF